MTYSQETLQTIARQLWDTEVPAAEASEVLRWVNLCLEGLAELDALDLESVEPVPAVALLPPGAPGEAGAEGER